MNLNPPYNNGDRLLKYDEKTLKHLQKVQLMMLKDLIKICDDNNITYFLDSGTLLGATAITGGEILLKKVEINHITPIIDKLGQMGCKIKLKEREIELKAPKRLKAIDIKTMPYPGFPTDMQAIMGACLTMASGTSIITENIFENRFKYLSELEKMGAKVKIEGKSAIIKGTRTLYGTKVNSTDLRGGASMVLAGLSAKGTTKVDNIEYILRGYEKLDEKLNNLGAEIYKI